MSTCSILINNYNNAPFLRTCIDSALAQSRPADEVIIYDDGSTDGSREIIESYGDRVKAILAPHFSDDRRLNLVNAVNENFRHSSGDFVFYLDGDDVFLPGKLEAYLKALEAAPDALVVQAPLGLIDKEGVRYGQFRHEWVHRVEIRESVRRTRDLDFFYPTSALGLRADFLRKLMPLKLDEYSMISPDMAFCINAILLGRVVTLDGEWTLYRRHPGNMSLRFRRPFYRARYDRQVNRYHNDLARSAGERPLRLWMNKKFYRRVARQVLDVAGGRRRRG